MPRLSRFFFSLIYPLGIMGKNGQANQIFCRKFSQFWIFFFYTIPFFLGNKSNKNLAISCYHCHDMMGCLNFYFFSTFIFWISPNLAKTSLWMMTIWTTSQIWNKNKNLDKHFDKQVFLFVTFGKCKNTLWNIYLIYRPYVNWSSLVMQSRNFLFEF